MKPFSNTLAELRKNFKLFTSYGISVFDAGQGEKGNKCTSWSTKGRRNPSLTPDEFEQHIKRGCTMFAAVPPEGMLVLDLDLKCFVITGQTDEDTRNQVDSTALGILAKSGDTLTVRTQSGGYHIYLNVSGAETLLQTGFKIGEMGSYVGELRVGGKGYGMLPGSRFNGKEYTLLDASPVTSVQHLTDLGVHLTAIPRFNAHPALVQNKTSEPFEPLPGNPTALLTHVHLLNPKPSGLNELRASCPVCQDDGKEHSGAFTIDTKTGKFQCWKGCTTTEVYKAVMRRAIKSGQRFPFEVTEKHVNREEMAEYSQSCALTIGYDVNLAKSDLVDGKYLPTEIADRMTTGIVVLNSAKGSGKSFLLRHFVDRVVKAGYRVVFVYHRLSLCGKIANDCNLQWVVGGKVTIDEHHPRGWALCHNSLHKLVELGVSSNTILVMDECESGLAHAVGSGIRKDERNQVLEALREMLTNAPQVILSDADISDISLNYVKHYRPDNEVFAVLNTTEGVTYPVDLYGTLSGKHEVTRRLSEDLAAGKRVLVTTDSKENGYVIEVLNSGDKAVKIDGVKVNAKTLYICQDTKDLPEAVRFVTNPDVFLADEEVPYQLVILSPTVDCGLSIDTNYFDVCYGFNYGVVSVMQASQALARVRAAVPRVIWVAPKGVGVSSANLTKQSAEDGVIQRVFAEVQATERTKPSNERMTREQMAAVVLEKWVAQPCEGELQTALQGRSNFSRFHHVDCFKQQMNKEGHTVRDVTGEDARFKAERMSAKAEVQLRIAAEIATAPQIDYTTYSELMKSTVRTYQQNLQVERFLLADTRFGGNWELAGDVDFLLKVHVEKRGVRLQSCRLFLEMENGSLFACNRDSEQLLELLQSEAEVFMPDAARNVRVQRVDMLERLAIYEVFLSDTTQVYKVDDVRLKRIAEKMRKQAKRLNTTFGVMAPKTGESPVRAINEVLDAVGLKLTRKASKVEKKMVYSYVLDSAILHDEYRVKCLDALRHGIKVASERQAADEHEHF